MLRTTDSKTKDLQSFHI